MLPPKKAKELQTLDQIAENVQRSTKPNPISHLVSALKRKKKIQKGRFVEIAKGLDILLRRKRYLQRIFKWIIQELFKEEEEKRASVLNKTLMIYGGSGVGKTTFIKKIIDPYFKTGPLFLDMAFQPATSVNPEVKVFVSPDNAPIKSLYAYSLLANQEQPINIKYSPYLSTQTTNSVIILTNHPPNTIKKSMIPEDWKRLNRRLIRATVDFPNFYKFFQGDKTGVFGVRVPTEELAWAFWVWLLKKKDLIKPKPTDEDPYEDYLQLAQLTTNDFE